MAEERDEVPVRFTDEEAADLRQARFGQLPGRVLPEERVEQVETEALRDVPEPAGDPSKWFIRYAGL